MSRFSSIDELIFLYMKSECMLFFLETLSFLNPPFIFLKAPLSKLELRLYLLEDNK